MSKVTFRKLSEDAIIPTRGSKYAVGMDLYSVDDYYILPGQRVKISTGIAVEGSTAEPNFTDADFYFRIAPRSGLAVNNGIDVMAGVVDADYRGEIIVVLYNTGSETFCVKKGSKCAQLIMERAYLPTIETSDELTNTARGADGFGSTDKNK